MARLTCASLAGACRDAASTGRSRLARSRSIEPIGDVCFALDAELLSDVDPCCSVCSEERPGLAWPALIGVPWEVRGLSSGLRDAVQFISN